MLVGTDKSFRQAVCSNKVEKQTVTPGNIGLGGSAIRYIKIDDAMGDLILIIDDEPDICQLLQLSLTKHGFKVKYVHALKDGLQFLQQQKPDILFLDIHLPDGSGLEILPKIKADYPDLPVISISAYDNGMEKQKALTSGAAHFLPKPFNVNELTNLLFDMKRNGVNPHMHN